jgi:hypothetical protein
MLVILYSMIHVYVLLKSRLWKGEGHEVIEWSVVENKLPFLDFRLRCFGSHHILC